MPLLYRATLSSLSIARATSLDKALLDHLEALSIRGYFLVYGVRETRWSRIRRFFLYDWPAAVRSVWKETIIISLIILLGAMTSYSLVASNPEWYYNFVGEDMAGGRDPRATAEYLQSTLGTARPASEGESGLHVFATYLFTHNSRVSIMSFALGFAFGVPTMMLEYYQGIGLGAMMAVFSSKGLGFDFGGWLFIDGTTELFAAALSGAAGLRIGEGRLSRRAQPVTGGGGGRTHRGQGDDRGHIDAVHGRTARRVRAPVDHRHDAALWHRHADAAVLDRLSLHPAARGCDMSAAAAKANAKSRSARAKKIRQFITPEGVDLELRIASSGLRFGALLVDLILIVLALFLFSLVMLWIGFASQSDITMVVWMLGAFLLRTFWFIGFELGSRAATPGKRLMGIRVVARDGGRLTADAVVARNLIRELELFLPLMMLGVGAAEDAVSGWTMAAGVLWSLTLSLFLLFNRDRMRMGDLIAGTWVVMAQRVKLDADIATGTAGDAMLFSEAELAVYGIFELQELERVLRGKDARAMREVADTIRAKIGRPVAEEDDVFLLSYYRQLKARLERKLLFGKRREDKYASD